MTTWHKSSYSDSEGNCVQVARLTRGVGVRDSKNPQGGVITVAPNAFKDLIDAVKAGQHT